MAKRRYNKSKKTSTILLGVFTGLLALTTAGLIGHMTNEKNGWFDDIVDSIQYRDYSVLVNEKEVEVETFKAEEEDYIYCYSVELESGDELVTMHKDEALKIIDSEETVFTCEIAGQYDVLVNENYEVTVVAPEGE